MSSEYKIDHDSKKESDFLRQQAVNSISRTTKITDMNADCLEKIFDHLRFNDMLNLADTSKHFHSALNHVFITKYQNKTILFDHKVGNFWFR